MVHLNDDSGYHVPGDRDSIDWLTLGFCVFAFVLWLGIAYICPGPA